MNIGYEKMYRDTVKRAEKAEAEADQLELENGLLETEIELLNEERQKRDIEQQIKGATLFASYLDGANFSAAIAARESGFFQLVESFSQQLRKELEK